MQQILSAPCSTASRPSTLIPTLIPTLGLATLMITLGPATLMITLGPAAP